MPIAGFAEWPQRSGVPGLERGLAQARQVLVWMGGDHLLNRVRTARGKESNEISAKLDRQSPVDIPGEINNIVHGGAAA